MCKDLVVPQVHEKSEFIVHTFYTEGCHVAYNTLHRSCDVEAGKKQVWIYLVGIPGLLVAVMLILALNSCKLAALVRIRRGEDTFPFCVQCDFCTEPAIAMGRKSLMIAKKKVNILDKCFFLR